VVGLGNLPALGNPKAKVTVVEFGDYQCPFCGRFYKTTEQQLKEEYVKTGKARFVWRDYAFLGEESFWAADAARCANDQGKFWEYHDLLFERQAGENEGAFAKENLKRFARELGLDGNAFDSCLESTKHRIEIESDVKDGSAYGVSGTPTTFINGQKVVGAVPYEQIKVIIDAALK
jgi:protein-disulfide isomerase